MRSIPAAHFGGGRNRCRGETGRCARGLRGSFRKLRALILQLSCSARHIPLFGFSFSGSGVEIRLFLERTISPYRQTLESSRVLVGVGFGTKLHHAILGALGFHGLRDDADRSGLST